MFESRSLPQDANGCKTPKSPFEPKSHEASSIKIVKSPIHLKRIHLRIYTYDLHRTVSKLSIPSFRAPPTGADKPAAHESHVQGLGTQALCCDMAESNPIQPCPTPRNRPAMVTIVCPPNTFNPCSMGPYMLSSIRIQMYSTHVCYTRILPARRRSHRPGPARPHGATPRRPLVETATRRCVGHHWDIVSMH